MSETVAIIVLPADCKLVKFEAVPRLTANALHPSSEDESDINAVKRVMCLADHEAALRAAAKSGVITPLNPHTHVPVPEWEHAQLMRAVMTRADFETFAARLLIGVESSDSPPGSASRHFDVGVSKAQIIGGFDVKDDGDENNQYWERKLRDPPTWLRPARISPGGKGKSKGSRWDPVLVAHALLDKGEMTIMKLDRAMRMSFPKRFDDWKDGTRDRR